MIHKDTLDTEWFDVILNKTNGYTKTLSELTTQELWRLETLVRVQLQTNDLEQESN